MPASLLGFGGDENRKRQTMIVQSRVRGNGQLQRLIEKIPPHAIEAEVCLLGSMIVEPQRIPEIRNIIHGDDFYKPANGTIYKVIVELYEAHGSLDVVQLHQLLVDRDILDAVGGRDYLVELANSMPSAANAWHYARLIREKATIRGVLELAGDMFQRAHETASDPLSIIVDAEAALQEIVADIRTLDPDDGFVCMADIEPEPVEPLWPGRFLLGKVNMLAGLAGVGKSFFSLYMAAQVSTGRCWPDDPKGHNPAGDVILLSAEDAPADTIAPRLASHDADCKRIFVAKRHADLARDIPWLAGKLERHPDTRLLVLDPLDAFLGKGVDTNCKAEVQRVLNPLAELARKHRVAIVGIAHLNKAPNPSALHRLIGSVAFGTVARTAWLIHGDADEPDRKLLLKLKYNVGVPAKGAAFRIIDGQVCWQAGDADLTADEVLGDRGDEHGVVKLTAAVEWLEDELSDGAVRATDIGKRAKAEGITKGTLRRAKTRLKARAEQVWSGSRNVWFWTLPPGGGEQP